MHKLLFILLLTSVTQSPISEWQDLKFGLMMHWGIYAQWGVVESWSICNESWIRREVLDDEGRPMRGTTGEDYYKYKQAYQGLNKSFAPRHFDPAAWAAAAKGAGMKYVVFTTKHHDGFCLFDTKYTDYSSTGPECPAQRDFTRGVVEAFRAAGLWTGLYFSKPDWHSDDYWAHEWATPDRNVNYSIAEHPERWQRFCDFTYGQLYELTHNYGKIDILWLDGGWIRPAWSVNEETRGWLGCSGQVQDIDMGRIAKMVREANPGMIIVDRSVVGEYEGIRCVLCATHDTASAVEGIPMEGNHPYISSGTWSLLGVKTPKPITGKESEHANYSNEGGVGYNRYQKNIMGMWLVNELQRELCPDMKFPEIVKLAEESTCDALIDANAPEFLSPKSMKAAFDVATADQLVTIGDYFRCAYRSLAESYRKAIEELETNTEDNPENCFDQRFPKQIIMKCIHVVFKSNKSNL